MKKTFLLILILIVTVFGGTNGVSAASPTDSNSISDKTGRDAAVYYVNSYSNVLPEWKGATVGNPVTYYSYDDVKSAYEFTVINNGKNVGFIMISARKDWMPVLEFGSGTAPSSGLEKAKTKAVASGLTSANDVSNVKYYYSGATLYNAQIGSKMSQNKKVVSLTDANVIDKPAKVDLKTDKKVANDTWDNLLNKLMAGSSSELLLNGSMESVDPIPPNQPSYWSLQGAGASYSRSTSQVHGGTYSLALTRNGADCQAYQNVPLYYVGTLNLSVWVWANGGSVYLSLNEGGTNFAVSTPHPGDSAWHQLQCSIGVSVATTLKVSLMVEGTNTTAYFDDASLPSIAGWGGYYALTSTDVSYGTITVPPYYQSAGAGHGDRGDTPGTWPNYVGQTADPWWDWDGCTPISGAMILGYWRNRGYTGIPDDSHEDELIDVNHYYMGTLDPGITNPSSNASGLHSSADYYHYNFETGGVWFDWDDVLTEINAHRPFIMTIWDSDFWNGHSVAAKGYAVDQAGQKFVHANNTWNTETNYYVQYDTWAMGWMTYAFPQPLVQTNSATSMGTNTATLNGNLTNLGGNSSISLSFEYGTTIGYGSTVTASPSSLSAPGTFSANISGLTVGTTYHFRAKAYADDFLIGYGADKTFSTTQSSYVYDLGITLPQYSGPTDIAVNSSTNVAYVVDANNAWVRMYNRNTGAALYPDHFGSYGTGAGQFNAPHSAAINSSGYVYVADTANNRIQKFTSTGTYQSMITTWGAGSNFFFPMDIVFDSSDNLYVVDTYNYKVHKYNSSGAYERSWGSNGSGDNQFLQPYSIAVDSYSNVYVGDAGGYCVKVFDSSGNPQFQFGSHGTNGTGDGEFNFVSGIIVDSTSHIFVTDHVNHRIQKFDRYGNYITKWGEGGIGDYKFGGSWRDVGPMGLGIDTDNKVYAADTAGYMVKKYRAP